MHQVPLDILAAFLGTLAVLQSLSFLFNHIQAAKRFNGHSTIIACEGTLFDEFEVTEFDSFESMKQEFEEIRSEVAMAVHLSTANG
jgi:hypothetical protein